MKTVYMLLFAYLIGTSPAFANGLPPSEDSIRELLQLTDAHNLIDGMKTQFHAFIAKSVQEANQGTATTPEKQAILDKMQTRMAGTLDEMLNWDSLLPMYIKTYQASFTQDELDGMTAFYKTLAGQAVVKKMPLVMQNVMVEMQGMMKPIQQKIKQIQEEALQEIKDADAAQKANGLAPKSAS
jgi:uncharacterized protein